MSRRRHVWSGALARRVVQVLFLLLFFGLVAMAYPRPNAPPSPWAKLFFLFDPLILIATWLTTHALVLAGLLSLVVVVMTVLLGRVFCGWVCPLGTIHAMAGSVVDRVWPNRKRRDHWSPWQLTKYYLLAGFLAMALLGVHWVCVLDPLVLLYRSVATAIFPGMQWAVEESSTAVYRADPHIGPAHATTVTEPVYRFFSEKLFVTPHQAFLGGGLIFAIFLALVLLNAYRRRFWCRYLCPLGALLGIFSWRPLLRRAVSRETCNQCDLCAMSCHGAAGGAPGDRWKAPECLGCLNCTDSCRRDSLHFTLVAPWRKEPALETVDLRKRALLTAAVSGLAGMCLLRSSPQARGSVYNPLLIRPPGAREERAFLQRCTACGLCMKVCPTGGLQPTLFEAGLEGLWTPRLVPHIGHCDYACNACTQVCPTEALVPLTVAEKQQTRVGLASFDITRCIPYAYGRDCIVCEEHCPIPDKAIYTLEVEIRDREGNVKTIKQPHVDPEKCIGCGECVHACPYKDRPGIYVTSANESRHPENQPIPTETGPY